MVELSTLAWGVLVLGALIVGVAKTALPGAATLAVALYAAVLPARESTGVLLLLLLTGDLLAVWTYRRDADWATLRRLAPPVIVGLLTGAVFLAWADDVTMRRAIGGIVLALTALTLWMIRRNNRRGTVAVPSPRLGSLFGALGGFTSMAANSGGPVMSLYFLAARFEVRRFLGTQAWFFFLINLLKLPAPLSLGLIQVEHLPLLAGMVPLVIVGALVGRRIVHRINQRVFDRIVIVLTIVSSLYLLR